MQRRRPAVSPHWQQHRKSLQIQQKLWPESILPANGNTIQACRDCT